MPSLNANCHHQSHPIKGVVLEKDKAYYPEYRTE